MNQKPPEEIKPPEETKPVIQQPPDPDVYIVLKDYPNTVEQVESLIEA